MNVLFLHHSVLVDEFEDLAQWQNSSPVSPCTPSRSVQAAGTSFGHSLPTNKGGAPRSACRERRKRSSQAPAEVHGTQVSFSQQSYRRRTGQVERPPFAAALSGLPLLWCTSRADQDAQRQLMGCSCAGPHHRDLPPNGSSHWQTVASVVREP